MMMTCCACGSRIDDRGNARMATGGQWQHQQCRGWVDPKAVKLNQVVADRKEHADAVRRTLRDGESLQRPSWGAPK